MIYKRLGFYLDLERKIQEYADEYCEGNFNLAVRKLSKQALARNLKDKCNEQD